VFTAAQIHLELHFLCRAAHWKSHDFNTDCNRFNFTQIAT